MKNRTDAYNSIYLPYVEKLLGGKVLQNILVTGADGGGIGNPLDLVGSGLDSLADDNDATTYSVGEIGADVAGVGMGVGRILAGDVLGGGKQLLGELGDVGKSIFGRKKAREEEERIKEEKRKEFWATQGPAAQQRVASAVMAGQDAKTQAATSGLEAMQEKYSQAGAKARGTLETGGIVKYEGGGHGRTHAKSSSHSSRPEDLKYMKYDDGGKVSKWLDRIQLGLTAGGMTPVIGAGADLLNTAISGGRTLSNTVGALTGQSEWSDVAKHGGGALLNLASAVPLLGQGVGGAKLTNAAIKTTTKQLENLKNVDNLTNLTKAATINTIQPFIKGAKGDNLYKIKATSKLLKGDKLKDTVAPSGPKSQAVDSPIPLETPFPFMIGKANKGARISFNPNDYYSGGYLNYL